MENMEEEMIFTKDDLTALRNKYGGSDDELASAMKELSTNFINPDGVTYSYSVVPRNSDDDDDRHELYEPRVLDRIRGHLISNNFWFQNHERAAMLDPSLRSEEGYRPFNIKTFVVDPDKIQHRMRNEHLEAASVALAFFNSKFPDCPPYIVEEVFGHQSFPKGYERWWHSNFKASRKDGSPSRLFFVEYYDRRTVPFCCILDGASCVRGCHFCGEEVVHPDDDRVLKSKSLDNGNPPSCLAIESFISRDAVVIRDIKDITRIFG
ncbi:uncharacterized protein LOC141612093 [Silene latifolia]|uniref:uncharacterized protein LOC141612093 n=1 Tax=Silene latifolia TaxID=37657 RepID=UPI003D787CD6